jgi:hypothetical protein
MPNSIHSLTLKLVSVCLYDGHWAKTAKAGSIGGTIEMGKPNPGTEHRRGGECRLPHGAAMPGSRITRQWCCWESDL